jgi:hypothetical protein
MDAAMSPPGSKAAKAAPNLNHDQVNGTPLDRFAKRSLLSHNPFMFARFCVLSLILLVSAMDGRATVGRGDAPADGGKKLDWERLMESTNTKPIVIPESSQTVEQVNASIKHWIDTRIAGPEYARLKGAADEAEVTKFLEGAFFRFARGGAEKLDPETVKQAQAILDGATRRPVVDYFVGVTLWVADRKKEAAKAFAQAAEAPESAPGSSLLRVMAQANVLVDRQFNDPAHTEAAVKLLDKLMVAHLAETPADEEEAFWLVHFHASSTIQYVRDTRERRYRELYWGSKLPEWARLTLAGDSGMALAWRKGGKGMVRSAGNPEEIREISEKAAADLTRAWELKPGARVAPAAMITMAARMGASPETLRLWFDRSMAAQFDYTPTFKNFLQAMTPYWQGSHLALLAFGRACAETKRFDTDVPTRFNEAVAEIVTDREDWRELYRNKEVSAFLFETRESRLKAVEKLPFDKNRHATCLCVEAWAVGDLDRAARALDQMKMPDGTYRYDNAGSDITYKLGVDFAHVMQEVWLYRGPARQDYEAGEAAMAKKEYDAASAAFQKAVGKAEAYGLPLLSANIALADFQKQYATGEWTAIPSHQRMAWQQIDNENNWDPEKKRLKLTGDWIFGRSLFRGELGKYYEVRGHFRTNHNVPGSSGLGFYNGNSPLTVGRSAAWWYTVRIDPQRERNKVDYAPKYDGLRGNGGYIPWAADTPFVLRRAGDKISFFVGDKEIVKDQSIPEDAPGGECAWGLGVLGQGKGAISLAWGLEARRLDGKQ